MEEELYACDRYCGYILYTVKYDGEFYTTIYYNGTCIKQDIRADSYSCVMSLCKDFIDELEGEDE